MVILSLLRVTHTHSIIDFDITYQRNKKLEETHNVKNGRHN